MYEINSEYINAYELIKLENAENNKRIQLFVVFCMGEYANETLRRVRRRSACSHRR